MHTGFSKACKSLAQGLGMAKSGFFMLNICEDFSQKLFNLIDDCYLFGQIIFRDIDFLCRIKLIDSVQNVHLLYIWIYLNDKNSMDLIFN